MQHKYNGRPRRLIAGKRNSDQYMLRMPPGMRGRLEKQADKSGRSINTEILDAIEKHLTGSDRFAQLWDFFQKHQAGEHKI